MNSSFYNSLDENFEMALKMSCETLTHEQILDMLKSGNIPQCQIAALSLTRIDTEKEAEILLSRLINCDGKIREAVALKLNELVQIENYKKYLMINPETWAAASIDINSNICRLVIDSATQFTDNEVFSTVYADCLAKYCEDAFDEISKFIFKDKKYTINKQMFKLYWSLEGLFNFYNYIKFERLKKILLLSAEQSEYTVREKVAKILTKNFQDKELESLRLKLKNDENYYVRLY